MFNKQREMFMQKKLLALAVAGALAPAAAMAQSTVEIYGRANLSIDSWKADGSTAGTAADYKRRTRVVDSGSRLGFRVNEGLGGGMRAFVVMETGVNIDNGNDTGQSGVTNTSTGTWASRDSYVGVGGGWGDVRFGRQSIWWSNGVIAQTGANYINTAADGVINDPGLLAIPVARQSNTVSYNSPTFGGFNASLSYSPGSESAGAAANTDASVWGITGRYTSGALRAQFDWARNKSASPTTGDRPSVTGTKVGVGWAYAPGSQISAVIGRYQNDNVAALAGYTTGGEDLKQNFWMLNWEHMIGPWQLLAQYYQNAKVKGLTDDSNTRAKAYTLAGKYYLSKRTGVYLSYTTVRNEARQFADASGGGFSSAGSGGIPVGSAGADVKVWGVGVMHNF
ncbi:MAG: porin [Betaproteobacteria bacterium]|nr:MAG: porin [Betaproteobacteria bacterium]